MTVVEETRPRLALLASRACLLADRIAASGLFDCRIWTVATAPAVPLSLVERVYRALDRRLFGVRRFGTAMAREGELLVDALMTWRPDQVICLVDPGSIAPELLAMPGLVLRAEGMAGTESVAAVRAQLGQSGGRVRLQWQRMSVWGGGLVFEAACAIDHRSLQRSIEMVAFKCPMALLGALRRLGEAAISAPAAVSTPIPRAPGKLAWRLLVDALCWPFVRSQWRLRLYRSAQPGRYLQPWKQLQPGPDRFWADPFVHRSTDGNLAVFFEDLPFATGRGHISMLRVDEQGNASAPEAVISEPWHLSYPFLLEFGNQLFMVPESSANRSVDLYVCDDYPLVWRKEMSLITGMRLADATFLHRDGRWWMFAAHGQDGASMFDELVIFWALDLRGPWHGHAMNPVKIDARSSRPAGSFFESGGNLIRPVQDCSDSYGGAIRFNRVLRLDEQAFEEAELELLSLPDLAPGVPVHTYNSSRGVICVDSLHRMAKRPRWC